MGKIMNTKKIVRIVYSSRVAGSFGFKDVKELSMKAAEYNRSLDITGLLIYGGGQFLQIIEGDSEAVNKLFFKIAKDPRHEHISIIDFDDYVIRQFKSWNMRCLILDNQENVKSTLTKYFKDGKFDPCKLSSKEAVSFLQDLKELVVD